MTENQLIRSIVLRPTLCFLVTLALLVISIGFALQVKKNTTPYFLDREHVERVKEDLMTDTFTRSKETIVLILKAKSGDVFSSEAVTLLEEIHKSLENLDLIELIKHKIDTTSQVDKASLIVQYNKSLSLAKNDQERTQLKNLIGQFLFPIRDIKS